MKVLEVKLVNTENRFEIENDKNDFKLGDRVIINNGQISELASIVNIKNKKSSISLDSKETWNLERIASEKDVKKLKGIELKAKDYLPICNEKIKKHGLFSMNLLGSTLSFDEKKLTFYFSAGGRVDFRELVSDLVKTFKKIIRLQQIGSRDEAKLIGGVGKCGRELCCKTFLSEIESITLEDAKEQDIVFGINKLSGNCGKLMCCLVYELEEYKRMAKEMPKMGDIVKVKKEDCRVVSRNLIKQTYTVENKEGQRIEVEK